MARTHRTNLLFDLVLCVAPAFACIHVLMLSRVGFCLTNVTASVRQLCTLLQAILLALPAPL
jgi:hypothetical protein